MAGSYYVFEYPQGTRDDIAFKIADDAPKNIPKDELLLKAQVEDALSVISSAFSGDKYNYYFDRLLAAARIGLVGAKANTATARQAIDALKNEIVTKESEFLKRKYFKKISAATSAVSAIIIIFFAISVIFNDSAPALIRDHLPKYFALMLGSCIGMWFISVVRNKDVSFEKLHFIEKDSYPPFEQSIFTCIMSLIFGLLLEVGIFDIVVAKVHLSSFNKDEVYALAIGIFIGISEREISRFIINSRKLRKG